MSRTWIATADRWKSRGSASVIQDPTPDPDEVFWEDDFSAGILSTNWGRQNNPFAAGNRESQMYRPANIVTQAATAGGTGNSCHIISRAETQTGLSSAPVEPLTTRSGSSPNYVYGTMKAAPMTQLPNGIRYWTSGMMATRDASPGRYFPLFGKFEIRAKFPFGQGTLPAFWLRRAPFSDGSNGGASWGEIDIFEHFGSWRHGYTKFSIHMPNTTGVNTTQQAKIVENPLPQRESTGWHVYDITIKPSLTNSDPLLDPIDFVTHLDGVESGRFRMTDIQSIRDLNMIRRDTGLKGRSDNLAWDICLNNAVGGQWVGQPDQQLGYLPMQDKCSINQVAPTGGLPSNCSTTNLYLVQFPCTFEIDYVRVWDLTPAP